MSDFELLKRYQKEIVELLNDRKKNGAFGCTWGNKARYTRLRIEIQKLMLEIERNMDFNDERWR